MPGQMRRLSAFLDTKVEESRWPAILEYCSFDWMKRNATKSVPLGGAFWDAGAEVFINKGVNRRWTEVLTPAESPEYEVRAIAELGSACAKWLATGEAWIEFQQKRGLFTRWWKRRDYLLCNFNSPKSSSYSSSRSTSSPIFR